MKTVLIIEDNEQNMYLLTYLLEASGYHVLQATSGLEGVKAAISNDVDIILLDIQLPGMDGYAVTREIRKSPLKTATPIIAVTSYAMPGDREHAMEAGCTGYIEKPINPETFISEMEMNANFSGGSNV
jgi:two-component system, cell cycle response regulator DivK